MAQVIWTELAFNDLEVIHDFIARESIVYAQSTVEGLFQRVEVLESFPQSGRTVPEYSRKDIRELIEGNYRIFYKIRLNKVFILRIHHSARNIVIKRTRK
jgi:toxin ParE1/3/4